MAAALAAMARRVGSLRSLQALASRAAPSAWLARRWTGSSPEERPLEKVLEQQRELGREKGYKKAEDPAPNVRELWGKVHSIESFSAVDGPGVRFLIFLQGCGLRCTFCSNPDTWEFQGGTLTSSKALAKRLDKLMPYLKAKGGQEDSGITMSGGEVLLQPEFAAAMCQEAHARGLTTCIDTAGQGTKEHNWDVVLPHVDYVLFCIKSPLRERYKQLTLRDGLARTLRFADELEERKIPYWVRYVLIPGLTDTPADSDALIEFCKGRSSIRAVEVLPYHVLGKEKWQNLGLVYPLEGMETPAPEIVSAFNEKLRAAGVPVLCA